MNRCGRPSECSAIHMKLYAQVCLKKMKQNTYFFLIRLMEILWYNWQSHALVQPVAVIVVGTPSIGVASCAQCSWSRVISRKISIMEKWWGFVQEGLLKCCSFSVPGVCFTNVSQTLQNNLTKIYDTRNHTSYENFKLKFVHVPQAWIALGTRTKFQLEILIRSTGVGGAVRFLVVGTIG